MYHYPWFKGLDPFFPVVSMHLIYQQFNCNSTNSLYTWKTSCWIKILKLQTLGNLCFIPSHYLEAVDNCSKEKVIPLIKLLLPLVLMKLLKCHATTKTFPLLRQCLLIEWIYIYMYILYIYRMIHRTENLNCIRLTSKRSKNVFSLSLPYILDYPNITYM